MRFTVLVLAAMMPMTGCYSGAGAGCSRQSECDDGLYCAEDLTCKPRPAPDMQVDDGRFVAPPDLTPIPPCYLALGCYIVTLPSDRHVCTDVLSSPDATLVVAAFRCVVMACTGAAECAPNSDGTFPDPSNCVNCALKHPECTGPLGKCSRPDGG